MNLKHLKIETEPRLEHKEEPEDSEQHNDTKAFLNYDDMDKILQPTFYIFTSFFWKVETLGNLAVRSTHITMSDIYNTNVIVSTYIFGFYII